jgi:hypothetical protein
MKTSACYRRFSLRRDATELLESGLPLPKMTKLPENTLVKIAEYLKDWFLEICNSMEVIYQFIVLSLFYRLFKFKSAVYTCG